MIPYPKQTILTIFYLFFSIPAFSQTGEYKYVDFNHGSSSTGSEEWVQSIRIIEPACRTDVKGIVTVRFSALGMTEAKALCWSQPTVEHPDHWGHDVHLTPKGIKMGKDGTGSFKFNADQFPAGPMNVRIYANNKEGKKDFFELQLYNKNGVKWNQGIPLHDPPGARGLKLVFSDDFDGPLSISNDGRNARYNAHKPRFGDFSGWPFSDVDGADNPFEQVDTYLKIKARKRPDTKGSTGLIASVNMDGEGFWVKAPFYMECRFTAQSAPGTWPAFWTITKLDRGIPGDELDIAECYGGVGKGNPNHEGYSLVSHFWGQLDETGNRKKEYDRRVPIMEYGGKSYWSHCFHIYGLYVGFDETIYYFDNIEVMRHPTNDESRNSPHIFLINYAIGGISGWPVDLERYDNGSDMYVDYVRVYANFDDKPELRHKETADLAKMLEAIPDGGATGEQQAWNLNWFLGPVLRKCDNATDDWLEPTERILNMLADKMAVGPDGYTGFIGPYIYNENEHWCDVHVGDALLVGHMLHFAGIIHQNPALKGKYGKSVDRFVQIAKKDLIEKWEKRGTFVVDGPFAGYREWNMYCKPEDIQGEWYVNNHARGQNVPTPCLPFNKALDMAYCMLQLYEITGEKTYKEKAEKIYNRFKVGLNPFQGGYTWNYWEPVAPEDIDIHSTRNERILSHWVGTHPYRDYQAGEMEKIVYAYNMGVTFTDADIQRFIHTNLKFMWNGNRSKPEWENSNSKLPGYKKPPPSTAYPTTAGIQWNALAQFDTTILYLQRLANNRTISEKHHTDIAGFVRKYAPNEVVKEPQWMKGIGESAGQMSAIVIPSVVPSGESTVILSKSDAEMAPVEILVRPLKGSKLVPITVQQMGNGIQLFHVWDGKINGKRKPGEYVVIWKYRGGERAYPVTLK